QFAAVVAHAAYGSQIEPLAADLYAHARPESTVRHLGEIVGIAVFPPPHARLVRIVDAPDVVALQHGTRIALLEVGTASHDAVAQCEKRLGGFDPRRIETILDDLPVIGLNKSLGIHSFFHKK